MSPEWRRILSRHKGKTLVEFCRRPKIDDQIAGFVIDYSDSLVLLHRINWDAFVLNGYTILRQDDIEKYRFFARETFWQKKAVDKFKLACEPTANIALENWTTAIASLMRNFPLITVHREIAAPDKCYVGVPLRTTANSLIWDDLDINAEWSGPRRIKLDQITRIDFDGGYERALDATAPQRLRPPGYFKNSYSKAEVDEQNRIAKFCPQRIVR